ncbi:MAG TPA: tRNA pseudouridine(55) synthase TruB [Terriglobales bacterium]|jgi:tRNA pseudouridine55 synthase|nr:tRNA pseudouridine(55) synthase TruB [Terriglobales bacterium]
MNAVLIIDKPSGFTSHDVVARVRRILQQRSVGHLGTLDPMATGVLPLVLGNMTRLAQFYLKSEKTYEGVIRFGFATDTYDAEGEPAGAQQSPSLSLEQVRQLATNFTGIIDQMPPPYSAKKIGGVPAYKLARKKQEIALKPVQVEIKDFKIILMEGCCASFQARVASGTYMRSIAHDMGQLAGCGAHLQSLRRTAVAEFELQDAHTLEELEQAAPNVNDRQPNHRLKTEDEENNSKAGSKKEGGVCSESLAGLFVHPRKLLPSLPAVTATDDVLSRVRHGRPVNLPELSRAREVKVFSGQRDLVAICTRVAGTLFHPKIVLL